MISLLFKGYLNSEQRKAPSRTTVRNTAEIVLPDTVLPSQASADLPSPAKPKRARIAMKREKEWEEPIFVEPVSKGGAELVGRVLRHQRNNTERICRLPPNKPENLRGQVGHAGNPSKLLRRLRRAVP